MIELRSVVDPSINIIEEQLVGFVESRYVRKTEEYFIAYLSSQTGCNRGCKFCHLTATGQTQFDDCDVESFMRQAEGIFDIYEKQVPAKYMHYNFMARGEPLANKHLIEKSDEILVPLAGLACEHKLFPKFNISTIMPVTLKKSLCDIFPIVNPTIYYSLYSVNQDFRDKWMPAALSVDVALGLLGEYQKLTKKKIKVHGCFIKDENDSTEDMTSMIMKLKDSGLDVEFNIVHYNPYGAEQGLEAEQFKINEFIGIWKEHMPGKKIQIIPRVGPDVYASCGTFYQ